MSTGTIKLLEKRLNTLDLKQELTKDDIQSVPRLSKLLSDMSNDFNPYQLANVDQLQNDEETASD